MFNKNLKRIRLQNGYTQKNVADFLHVSSQSISKWENGVATPSIEFLPKLAKMLDCSIDDLFKTEEDCVSSKIEDVKKFLSFLAFFDDGERDEKYKSPTEFMSCNEGWQDNCKSVYNSLSKQKFVSLQALQSIFGCTSNEVKAAAEMLEKNDVLLKVPDSKLYAVNAEAVDCSFPIIKVSRFFAELGKGKSSDEAIEAIG